VKETLRNWGSIVSPPRAVFFPHNKNRAETPAKQSENREIPPVPKKGNPLGPPAQITDKGKKMVGGNRSADQAKNNAKLSTELTEGFRERKGPE